MAGFGADGTRDFFSQPDPNSHEEGFDLFFDNAPRTPVSTSVSRLAMEGLALNSQPEGFPNMPMYQGILQHDGGSGSDACRRPVRSPPPPRGTGGPIRTLGLRKPRGGGPSSSRGRGRAVGLPLASGAPGASSGPGRVASLGSTRHIASDDTELQVDDDVQDNIQIDKRKKQVANKTDKAKWSDHNNAVLLQLLSEQIELGNYSKGIMSKEGYRQLESKYYCATGLRHDTKQLSGRIRTLKQMYGFIKDMHTDSGLDRDDRGWPIANIEWWDTNTKGCPEFKKLKLGPPEYFDLLEHCFHDVAIDGSTAFVPGQEEEDELNEDDEQEIEEEEEDLQETENSPMSSSGRKRGNSTSTRSTAESPVKKSKNPMLKVMKQYLHMSATQSAQRNQYLKQLGRKQEDAEARLEHAIKQAQQLAKQAGLDESSPEFYAVSHICKDEALMKFFINLETSEGRVAFLRRYCKEKNLD